MLSLSRFRRLESGYIAQEYYNIDTKFNFENFSSKNINAGKNSRLNDLKPGSKEFNNNGSEEVLAILKAESKFYSVYKYILELGTEDKNEAIDTSCSKYVTLLENVAMNRLDECRRGEIHPYLKGKLNESFKLDNLKKVIVEEDWFFFKELLEIKVSDTYIEFYITNFYRESLEKHLFVDFGEITKLYNRLSKKENKLLESLIFDYIAEYYSKVINQFIVTHEFEIKQLDDFDIDIITNVVSLLRITMNNNDFKDINSRLINYLWLINNHVIENMKLSAINENKLNQYDSALDKIGKIVNFYELISEIGQFESKIHYYKKAFNDLLINKSIDLTNNKKFSDSNISLRLIFSEFFDENQIEVVSKLERINNQNIEFEAKNNQSVMHKKTVETTLPKASQTYTKANRFSFGKIILIISSLFIARLIFNVIINSESKDSTLKNSSISGKEQELPLPPNGEVFRKSFFDNEMNSPYFKIIASSKNAHVVKIYKANSNDLVVMFFVRSGQSVIVEVPSGSYEIKVASGESWYGLNKLFGEETNASILDKVFTLSTGESYEITLKTIENGNLDQTYIDLEDF